MKDYEKSEIEKKVEMNFYVFQLVTFKMAEGSMVKEYRAKVRFQVKLLIKFKFYLNIKIINAVFGKKIAFFSFFVK